MKLTLHPDGRKEIDGTPEELREFDAAQPGHAYFIPAGLAAQWRPNVCAGGALPMYVAEPWAAAMRGVQWNPGRRAAFDRWFAAVSEAA